MIFLSSPAASASFAQLGDVGHSLLTYRIGEHWLLLDLAHLEGPIPSRPPRVDTAIDPELAAYAHRAGYPIDRAQYPRFSATALKRLAGKIEWRARHSSTAPER